VATIPEALAAAVSHHRAGRLELAEQIYRQILEVVPHHPDALHLMGVLASQRGRHEAAVDSIRRAIRVNPHQAVFYSNLGLAYRALGRLDEAVASYRQAARIAPDSPDAHYDLGLALKDQGKLDEAIARYRQALAIRPDHVRAHNSLGNVLNEQGKLDEALGCYQTALQLQPDYTEAHVNLGAAYRAQGKLAEAVASYQRALQLRPDYAEAHHNLGNVFKTIGELDQAAACYRQALRFKPDYAKSHNALGNVFKEQGKLDEAEASFRRALALCPDQPLWELRITTLCPPVFAGSDEIDRYRRERLAAWTRFAERNLHVNLTELATAGCEPPLGLQYHGRNDRAIKEAYASIFRNCFPEPAPAVPGGRPRIGFVVTAGHEGIFLRYMRGILERIDRDFFEPVIVCTHSGREKIRAETGDEPVPLMTVSERFDQLVEAIRAGRFDLLFHWEVGTDTTDYFLPFFRLAPVQCTSWGIPVTSGIPQMDYYVSSELLETEEAADHYTEKLVKLKTLPTYCYRSSLQPSAKTRDDFGLPGDRPVYLCAQNLLKLHPDFDASLAEILRRDPHAELVLCEGRFRHWIGRLRNRFSATMPDVLDRIRFLPNQAPADFFSMVAACDVVLDTFYCGGGATTYDALTLGTPIVTWPTAFMRGRITYGCYQKMGVLDCVASDPEQYVKIAVRLGTDREYRESVRGRIAETSRVLFDDAEAVAELEQFFHQAIEAARGGQTGN
jgi:protein O-GlcNAc transferase